MNRHHQFHITHDSQPNEHWPTGTWALYQLTGDDIARRIKFDAKGEVVERTSWPGFIGCFSTLAEVSAAIEEAMK